MKALIKLLLWIAGLALVVVVGLGAAIATLDPNDHKERIIAEVQQRTGRTLQLEGELGLSLYPWLGLEMNQVTVGNAPGFGDEPFLAFEHLKARVKLLPLLREKYEIDTVSLHGATLNLARNADGTTNWQDLAGGGEEEAQPLPLTAVVLGGVDIRDMRLNWSDATTGARYEVSALNATTGALTYGEPIKLALSAAAKSSKPALTGELKLDGTIDYDLDQEIYSVSPLTLTGTVRGAKIPGGTTTVGMQAAIAANLRDDTATVSGLKLDLLDTHVEGEIKASRIESPTPALQAALKVRGQDLALLFRVLEIEPLAGQLAQLADRSFRLDSSIDADTERGDVNLSGLELDLLGASIRGDLKATNTASATPGVRGRISAAGPDLPALLRVAGQFQKDKGLAAVADQAARAADKAFRVETEFDIDMKSGDLAVPALSAELLGARAQGKLEGRNVQGDKAAFKGSLTASGSDLPLLLRAAGALQPESALAAYGAQLAAVPERGFELQTDFDADLGKGNIDLPALDARALGLVLKGKLAAQNMQASSGSIDGELDIKGEKLAPVLRALEQAELAESLRALELKARISGTRSDLNLKPLQVQAVIVSEETGNKPAEIALKADTRVNLDKEELDLSGLSLSGLGLKAAGELKAVKVLSAPEFSGRLDVPAFNLRQFARRLGQTLPPMADKTALRNVALQSEFSGSKTSINLSRFALLLDDSNIKGSFSFANPEQPVLRFGIEVDQIDFDRYLPPEPAGKNRRAPATPEGAAAAAATQLPVELLRKLDVQGSLTVGKLVYAKAQLSNVKLAVNGKDGALKLDPVTAQLYQGSYSGNVGLDARGKLPKLTVNSQLKGIQFEPLLKDTQGKAKLRGQGDFSAALVAAGADSDALKKTLNGQMGFVVRNGALKGFNLGKVLRGVKQFKKEGNFSVEDQEETDFSEITGNPVAKNGVIFLDDFSGKSPAFRFSGKGVIRDLPRDRIDYVATATVVSTSKGQGGDSLAELDGIDIPVKIKGPSEDPKISVDFGGIAMNFAKKEAQDKLLEKIGVKEAAGSAADGTTQQVDPKKQLLDKALKNIFD